MGIRITKELDLEYGHRLQNHESKCRNIHGHHGHVLITVEGDTLDHVGRVIDFSVVKRDVGRWMDMELDHALILCGGDPLADRLKHDTKMYLMDTPPTAENLARIIFEKAQGLLRPHHVRVTSVRFYETPTCFADYDLT